LRAKLTSGGSSQQFVKFFIRINREGCLFGPPEGGVKIYPHQPSKFYLLLGLRTWQDSFARDYAMNRSKFQVSSTMAYGSVLSPFHRRKLESTSDIVFGINVDLGFGMEKDREVLVTEWERRCCCSTPLTHFLGLVLPSWKE
jgi:hypothetical protein